MKRTHSFRLSEETIKKLDRIVEFENENLEKKGIIALEYNRTSVLELLIEIGHSLMKKNHSIQDLKILMKEMMKNGKID